MHSLNGLLSSPVHDLPPAQLPTISCPGQRSWPAMKKRPIRGIPPPCLDLTNHYAILSNEATAHLADDPQSRSHLIESPPWYRNLLMLLLLHHWWLMLTLVLGLTGRLDLPPWEDQLLTASNLGIDLYIPL